MTRLPLIVHERVGTWARHLRPRVVGWPVRLAETRSAAALEAASRSAACPLAVFDLGGRPAAILEDLDRLLQRAPEALALVLDPGAEPEVALVARELGAAHVMTGSVPPPTVVGLLARWVPLALRRAERQGWVPGPEPGDSEPIDPLDWVLATAGLAPAAPA